MSKTLCGSYIYVSFQLSLYYLYIKYVYKWLYFVFLFFSSFFWFGLLLSINFRFHFKVVKLYDSSVYDLKSRTVFPLRRPKGYFGLLEFSRFKNNLGPLDGLEITGPLFLILFTVRLSYSIHTNESMGSVLLVFVFSNEDRLLFECLFLIFHGL